MKALSVSRRSRAAFSLVEILVTVGLLSFIILGLLAMFHQTQRAFRSSITQSDVLEGGRAITDMLVREFEQMSPSLLPHLTNSAGAVHTTTNFFAEPAFGFSPPLIQDLPGSNNNRTNLVQRFFFLKEENRNWTGVGYLVIPVSTNTTAQGAYAGVGTLYRFQSSANATRNPRVLSKEFVDTADAALGRWLQGWPLTNLPIYRVADGVVHLRARALAPNGYPLTVDNGFSGYWRTVAGQPQMDYVEKVNMAVYSSLFDPTQIACYLVGNVVPATVELEVGLLEPQVLRRAKGLGTVEAQRNYLADRSANVHIFRQQIPIRNVDLKAY